MPKSTAITPLDEFAIVCATQLPTFMNCQIRIGDTNIFQGTSVDFQIEHPSYKDPQEDEKYFDGKLTCYAYTEASVHSEVVYFDIDIKGGKFSFESPKFDIDYATGPTFINCHGIDIDLPDHFGVALDADGLVIKDAETRLQIRAEYKRNNISHQYADASKKYPGVFIVGSPYRDHGKDSKDLPIPYKSLSESVSIESSNTIFDAKEGFKLVLKNIHHNIQGLSIRSQSGSRPLEGGNDGPRFSSLVPLNTYYESGRGNYVNCTAEVSIEGSTTTFDTTMDFESDFAAEVKFQIRNTANHGTWEDVIVDTIKADVSISCPHLTLLNPTELPIFLAVTGKAFSDKGPYDNHPSSFFISSGSGLASLVVFSAVGIAAAALSLF